MNKNKDATNNVENTLSILSLYIEQMQANHSDKLSNEDKKVKVNYESKIPKKDVLHNFGNKDAKKADDKKDKKRSDISIDVLPYASADAIPYIPLTVINDAISAINELKELKSSTRQSYLVVFMTDTGESGSRELFLADSWDDAATYANTMYNEAIDEIKGFDKFRTVYIDESRHGQDLMHEPTPSKYVDDDETYKCEALVDGKILAEKDHGKYVILNKEKNEVMRWDIYNLKDAKQAKIEDE